MLAIGDSIMLGASNALQAAIPGVAVDAAVSRQFGEAVGLVGFYKEHNVLPNTIVIHLGTNGRATDGAIDQIMSLVGNDTVYFLTARVPRSWEAEVNDVLHRAAQRHKNLKVLEWRDYAGCHDDWFVGDGFHLQYPNGKNGYAAVHQGRYHRPSAHGLQEIVRALSGAVQPVGQLPEAEARDTPRSRAATA